MKVICISGKAQHGKDTFAKIIKTYLEKNGKKVLIAHFGDLVKFVCEQYFNWDGQKNEDGRTLLQKVGTDIIRNQVPDYWVNFVCDMLQFFDGEWDYVLIPDCRFPNECEVPKNRGLDVCTVRVTRKNFVSSLTEEQKNHPSEIALDDYTFDYDIINEGSVSDLHFLAFKFLEEISGESV